MASLTTLELPLHPERRFMECLSVFDVLMIRMRGRTERYSDIAKEYGRTGSWCSQVAHGYCYQDIPGAFIGYFFYDEYDRPGQSRNVFALHPEIKAHLQSVADMRAAKRMLSTARKFVDSTKRNDTRRRQAALAEFHKYQRSSKL